jgi:hypothetical protein
MISGMKELEEESRRLRKMIVDERLRVEIVQEALAKKWWVHLAPARWTSEQCKRKASPLRWLANPFR